jgi:hypothetical protein
MIDISLTGLGEITMGGGRLLVTGITFGVFMTEALIHYNMGKAGPDGKFQFHLPPAKELMKIAAVTGTFSLLSGVLIDSLQRKIPPGV